MVMVGPDFSDWLTKVLIKIKTVKHQIKAMPFTLMKIFKLKLLILIITIIIIIEETWPRCQFYSPHREPK